jgi:hypothetical protein
MVHRRGLVSGVWLGWTSVVSGVGLCWTPVPSIGFAAGEERDGAPERGISVGLEREELVSGWRERWCTGEVWSPASGWAFRAFDRKLWGWGRKMRVCLYGVLILF